MWHHFGNTNCVGSPFIMRELPSWICTGHYFAEHYAGKSINGHDITKEF